MRLRKEKATFVAYFKLNILNISFPAYVDGSLPSHLFMNSLAIRLSVKLCFNKSFAFLVASASTILLSASSLAFSSFCSYSWRTW